MIPRKQTAVAVTCAAVAATVLFVPAVPAQQTLPAKTAPTGQEKSGKKGVQMGQGDSSGGGTAK